MSGVAAAAWFWIALFGVSRFEPGYSHRDDVVSALGAVGATHPYLWNLLGFLTPGLLLVVFFAGLAQTTRAGRILRVLLVTSGLGFAASALPANLADVSATATRLHLVAASLSLVSWLVAVPVLALRHRGWMRWPKTVCE